MGLLDNMRTTCFTLVSGKQTGLRMKTNFFFLSMLFIYVWLLEKLNFPPGLEVDKIATGVAGPLKMGRNGTAMILIIMIQRFSSVMNATVQKEIKVEPKNCVPPNQLPVPLGRRI